VRRNASPITEANWSSSTQVSGETSPVAPGQEDWVEVAGLSPCTVYYFGLKSDDDNSNLSAVGDTTSGRCACWGGGLSARRAPAGDASAGRTGGSQIERGSGVLDAASRPVGGTIVAERRRVTADRWEVHLSRVSSVPGLDPDQSGIVVQSADGQGGWHTIGTFDPGEEDEIAIASLRGGLRVVFPGNWLLGRVSGAGVGEAGAVSLTAAEHSGQGDVTGSVSGGEVELLADETLTLTYESIEASGDESGWFLTMQRGGSGTASRRGPAVERVPTSFALHQNEPNPFGSSTMIRFDLPRAAQVKLEVFDLLGRRVATLADAEFAAGFHTVPWRTGAELGPGIYMYRVIAGEFSAQRKMIVLP
jgi:hypothetical protein